MFRIGGNTFHDRKNKIPMKILEFIRSGDGLIAEFRRIPNGFHNQERTKYLHSKKILDFTLLLLELVAVASKDVVQFGSIQLNLAPSALVCTKWASLAHN
jgi:hypothetical protein